MAGETFWNNREQAQKLIDEANTLRKKDRSAPQGGKAARRFPGDGGVGRSRACRCPAQTSSRNSKRDLATFFKELDALELQVFLNGPHDKNNCILSINAGAGGTEACDWANMLLRMYQRWAESRGWEVEVTRRAAGRNRGHQERHVAHHGRECLRLLQSRARRASAGAHFAVRFEQTAAHQLCQRGCDRGNRRDDDGDRHSARRNFRWTPFAPAARAGRT